MVPSPSKSSWHTVIFGSALVIRLLHALSASELFMYRHLIDDAARFDGYAWKIAAGTIRNEPLQVALTPVYLGFLAFFYKLFGHYWFWPRAVQILMGSLVCVLLYDTARRLWSERAARLTGLMAAFYGIFIFYDFEILKPSLTNFFLILAFYTLTRSREKPSFWIFFSSGALMACAVLLRMNTVLVLPFVAFWILKTYLPTKKTAALAGLIFFLAGYSLCQTLWKAWFIQTIPNQQALFTESGIHFYIGNNPLATGTYKAVPGVAASPKGHTRDARRIAEEARQSSLNPAQVNQYWIQRAFDYIRQNPGKWLVLSAKKTFLLLNSYEVPNNENYDYARSVAPILGLPLVSAVLVLPLGLLGMLAALKDKRPAIQLWILFFTGYALSLILTFVTSNYRLPLYLPMLLFAGYALDNAIQEFKQGVPQLQRWALFFLVFWIFCNYETFLSKYRYDNFIQKRIQFYSTPYKKQAPLQKTKVPG